MIIITFRMAPVVSVTCLKENLTKRSGNQTGYKKWGIFGL